MEIGNSKFYHHHINNSIQKVDNRKQKFIKYRLQFLKKKCQPLDQKIQQLNKQIQYYSNLVKNQNQMIENEQEVVRLKKQVQQFQNTQNFFLQHLQQYQTRIIQLMYQNQLMQEQIGRKKQNIQTIAKEKFRQIYKQFNNDIMSNKSYQISDSKVSQNMKSSNVIKKRTYFPLILKNQKYYAERKQKKNQEQIGEDNNKSLIKKKSISEVNKSLSKSIIGQKQLNNQQRIQKTRKQKQLSLKLRFKQMVSDFNRFELLFKQCFDKKKHQVQKSVSQLQSKLIKNRQRFLEICQAIGQRSMKRISFQQFETLTGDEIMTLFISFPWIQKAFFEEFMDRRKQIVEIQMQKVL